MVSHATVWWRLTQTNPGDDDDDDDNGGGGGSHDDGSGYGGGGDGDDHDDDYGTLPICLSNVSLRGCKRGSDRVYLSLLFPAIGWPFDPMY